MRKITKIIPSLLLLTALVMPLRAVELVDTEVFGGAGFEFINNAGYVFPATTAIAGVGGYITDLPVENLFVEATLSQSIIPAFDTVGSSFFTNVALLTSLVYLIDDVYKIKPKVGVNFAYGTAVRKFALSVHYGLTGYYFLEDLGFDVYVDLENSLNFFVTASTLRLSGGVQMPFSFL